jgi:SAM-dependent methyltransferase
VDTPAPLSCHGAEYSALYDDLYRDKDYAAEAAFVGLLLDRHGGGGCRDLLELACGTGEHAFALERLGHRIVATDLSPYMIARAAEKARERRSRVEFRVEDMRRLPFSARFDAAYCLFDSLGFVETDTAIVDVLRQVNRALRPRGLFVFEFLHAPTMTRRFDPVRVRRVATPAGELLRIAESSVDADTGRCSIRFTLFRPLPGGTWERTEETHRNRALTVAAAAGLLGAAGFEALEWCDGYRSGEVDESTWHVVAVARKHRETETS